MWLDIQIFGFRALWSPLFLTFIICISIAYFLITGPMRDRFGKDLPAPTISQQLYFYSSMLLIYLVKGAPVDLLSHIMMSAHMIQMAILYFIVPIFIIRGIPKWVLRKFISLPIIRLIFKIMTHPLIALAVFNSFFAMYHLPLVFDFTKSHQFVHTSVTLFLFVTAMTMWWPIVTPLKEHNKLHPLVKMSYLLGSIFMIAIPCALIIFASDPLFDAYSSQGAWMQSMSLCVPTDVLNGLSGDLSGPEMFSPLDAQEDQQLGGVIMLFLQELIYGVVLATIFFGWFSKKSMEIDPLPNS